MTTTELRALLAAGTPGPWRLETDESGDGDCIAGPPSVGADIVALAPEQGLDSRDLYWTANAALLVAMHRALPLLLDAVEAAEKIRERLATREGVEDAEYVLSSSDYETFVRALSALRSAR